MRFLIQNAEQLITCKGPSHARSGTEMSSIGVIQDGAVLVDEGKIVAVGTKSEVMAHPDAGRARVVDAEGRVVASGFVDSHAHPVFAAPRLNDFAARTAGKSYEKIAADGGGILSSVKAVREFSEEHLANQLAQWAGKFLECGTTTLEAKSGYGLEPEAELKMLRAVRRAQGVSALEFVPTALGAHAVPEEFKKRRNDYIQQVCETLIPAAAKDGLARFVDVFCEKNYFTPAESEKILRAGVAAGLAPKIHAEQLSRSGGAAVAARVKAVSADHLDHANKADLSALKRSGTVATLLPAASYFLGGEYPQARRFIEANVPVALATDFNPGTAPCWNMQMVLSLACTQLGMTPQEAWTAATINGAHALGLGATHGSIEPGKQADLVIYDAEDYREIPYYFGANLAIWVMKKGSVVHAMQHLRPFD